MKRPHRLIIAFLAFLLVSNFCAAEVRAVGPVVLGPGALAPADSGCLERVQERRLSGCCDRNLEQAAGPDVVLLAVESCDLVGYDGWVVVDETGIYPARVVDCQQATHEPLSVRGLVADVSLEELGHKQAVVVLWE